MNRDSAASHWYKIDLPGNIQIALSRELSSLNSEHRQRIRQALAMEIKAHGQIPLTDVHDICVLPRLDTGGISISHCQAYGGWARSSTQAQLGFDVEVSARVRAEIVQRMSTADEFASAPKAVALWTAKEAGFKSLWGPTQPAVATEVKIESWERDETADQGYRFWGWGSGVQLQGLSRAFNEDAWWSVCSVLPSAR